MTYNVTILKELVFWPAAHAANMSLKYEDS